GDRDQRRADPRTRFCPTAAVQKGRTLRRYARLSCDMRPAPRPMRKQGAHSAPCLGRRHNPIWGTTWVAHTLVLEATGPKAETSAMKNTAPSFLKHHFLIAMPHMAD